MLMNNRAEVTPRIFIYGIIVFTLMIGGVAFIMSQFAIDSPSFTSDENFQAFNSTFNKYNDVVEVGTNLSGDIQTSQPNPTLFGVLDSLVNSGWVAIKSLFNTLGFVNTIFGGLTNIFGIPSWIVALLTTLMVVMIAFSIYSLIFQGKT